MKNDFMKRYGNFLWHGSFLALTMAFVEINTVIPSLILKAGGGSFSVGLVSAILTGIPLIAQLLFAGFLMSKPRKKPYLIFAIYLRIISLAALGFILGSSFEGITLLIAIFIVLSIFSFSGVFAGISYTDLLGKTVEQKSRRKFMAIRQILSGIFSLLGGLIAKNIVSSYVYPENYSLMFFIASISLMVGSAGFFLIKENKSENRRILKLAEVIRKIPSILKDDSNLKNYVLFSNSTGFGLVIIPFYIVLARNSFGLSGEDLGMYVFLQMIGMTVSGFLWGYLLSKWNYYRVMRNCVFLGATLPIIALILSNTNVALYSIVFILSGSNLSVRKMTFEGLLIEISNKDNRALYTGIVGALNLVLALLPLVIGSIIDNLGFTTVFIITSAFILLGFYYLRKIKIV